MNPNGYLRGLNAITDGMSTTNLPPEDPDDPATWHDPALDAPFTVIQRIGLVHAE